MRPYYPARDGHPSMFAPEDNAGAVKKLQTHPDPKANELAGHHGRLAMATERRSKPTRARVENPGPGTPPHHERLLVAGSSPSPPASRSAPGQELRTAAGLTASVMVLKTKKMFFEEFHPDRFSHGLDPRLPVRHVCFSR